MADENLVSTVYFRGTNMGTSTIQIIDTSVPPNYAVTYLNEGHATNDPTKPMALRPGKPQVVELQQSPVNNDITKVYVKLSGTDASRYILSNVFNQVNTGGVVKGEVTITPSGYGKLNAHLNFWPAAVELNAVVEFFHDAAMTQKFLTVPLQTQPSTDAFLTITTDRENPSLTAGVYNNDSLIIMFRDSLSRAINYTTSLPFKLFIDDEEIVNGNYPDTGGHYFRGNVDLLLKNYGQGNAGYCKLDRQRNLAKPGNKTIRVQIGVRSETVPLLDMDNGILIGQNINLEGGSGLRRIGNVLPGSIQSTMDPNLSFAFGRRPLDYVPPSPATGIPLHPQQPITSFMQSLIAHRYEVSPKVLDVNGSGSNTDNFVPNKVDLGYTKGRITTLTWDTRTLGTAKYREQFGKYQASFSTIFKWVRESVNGTMVTYPKYQSGKEMITIGDINNPISTALYGALTRINFNDVAIFAFNTRDASLTSTDFESSPRIVPLSDSMDRFLISCGTRGQLPTLPPDTSFATDKQVRIDSLWLRTTGPNAVNQFSNDTPYPRFLNVQSKVGVEAFISTTNYDVFWDFTIDPSLGIDMTDPRYTFLCTTQQDGVFGFEIGTGQEQYLYTLSPHRAIFRSGWAPPKATMCIALIDLGPETPPINSTFKFKAVNLPREGSYVVNNGAGTFETAKYGNENLIVAKGVIGGLYCKFLTIVNKHTNAAAIDPGSWQNYVALEFYTDDSYTTVDSFSSKPTALKATFRGRTIPLTRANYNSQPITNSYHFYSLQAMDATQTNLQAWRSGMAESIGIETDITFVFN